MREARSAAAAAVMLSIVAALDEAWTTRDGPSHDDIGPLGRLAGSLRDRMLDVVGPDEIIERLDVNAVLERVDIDAVLERVDLDRVLADVDLDALVARIDVDALVARVDVNGVLARVDVNLLLARVDVNGVLARVDVNRLAQRVDVDVLVADVDVDALLARADVGRLLERVDIDAVIERVDVERIVHRAGIPEIVAESTGSLAESALDLLRRQLLALDVVLGHAITRALSRDESTEPAGPAAVAGDGAAREWAAADAPINDATGHYAGAVTRLVAFVIDTAIASGTFTFTIGALGSALRFAGAPVDGGGSGVLLGVALLGWLFAYWWASIAIAGRTPGMAIVGLRIVTRSGEPLSGRHAIIRVLTMPLSFALFGLGLLGIVFDREHRALHDLFASSTVVFDWGDRDATMPTPLARWLARHADPSTDVA